MSFIVLTIYNVITIISFKVSINEFFFLHCYLCMLLYKKYFALLPIRSIYEVQYDGRWSQNSDASRKRTLVPKTHGYNNNGKNGVKIN